MKKTTIVKKLLVFSVTMIAGLSVLYLLHFIWVISVLIVLGISLGVSKIPSEKIAPYPADVGVSFVNKVRNLLKIKSSTLE